MELSRIAFTAIYFTEHHEEASVELERMELRSVIVDAVNIISEQAKIIHNCAKEQYTLDLGGKVYKRNGISQFHTLADISREASLIEFTCSAINGQISLLDKLYANEPIISEADAKKAKEIAGVEDLF